jgi:Sulfotransferase domain
MSLTVLGPKVFGIGFHKTGTTSLSRALKLLGYRVCGPVGVRDPRIAERAEEMALAQVERFDAFQDNPWPLLFRALDERYPGSKFVLTVRPAEEWIRSLVTHFGRESTPMREFIYGAGRGFPRGNESHYLEVYETHNRRVLEHFEGREKDLLVLRITEGEGWERLCPFLDRPEPEQPFPLANAKGARRKRDLKRQGARYLRWLPGSLGGLFGKSGAE